MRELYLTGYKGGGNLREPWRRKVTAEKQPRVMLKEILVAARERRRQESGRRGGGKGGEEGEVTKRDG